jgi:hypothetical protein
MTDKELLELAAKAAGYKFAYEDTGDMWVFYKGHPPKTFHPIESNGDALKLAVRLNISLRFEEDEVWANDILIYGFDDKEEATRRAITCAAAKMINHNI